MQDLTQTYRAASDDEVARLYEHIDALTGEARAALLTEIERRKLTTSQLIQIREQLAEHAESVDKEWKEARKADAVRTMKRVAIRVAVIIAAGIIAALIALNNSGQ